MKIRKQYVIFGAILVALAIILFVSATRSSRHRIKSDNVKLDYSSTPEIGDEVVDDSDDILAMGDFSGEPLILDQEPSFPTEDEGCYLTGDSQTSTTTPSTSPVTDDMTMADDVYWQTEGTSFEKTASTSVEDMTLDMELYANLAMFYICGTDFDLIHELMTPELCNDYVNRSNTEPYLSLKGNERFDDIDIIGDEFSFRDLQGTKYKFRLEFEGDKISDIIFVE